MSVEFRATKDEGVKAFLDLHYKGQDAIIRAVTPTAYPGLKGLSGKTGVDRPVGTPRLELWRHVFAIDRCSHRATSRIARFPRRAHVTDVLKRDIPLVDVSTARCTKPRVCKSTVTSRSFTLCHRERFLSDIIKEKFTRVRTEKEEFLFGLGLTRSDSY